MVEMIGKRKTIAASGERAWVLQDPKACDQPVNPRQRLGREDGVPRGVLDVLVTDELDWEFECICAVFVTRSNEDIAETGVVFDTVGILERYRFVVRRSTIY